MQASSVALTAALFFVSEKQDTIAMPQMVRIAASIQCIIFLIIVLFVFISCYYSLSSKFLLELFISQVRSCVEVHASFKSALAS